MKDFGWEILTSALAICVLLGSIVRMILRSIDKKFDDLKADMKDNLRSIDRRVENAAVELKHRGEMVEKALDRVSHHVSGINFDMTILETRIQERNKILAEPIPQGLEKRQYRRLDRLRPSKESRK